MTASTQFEPSGTPIRRRLRVLIADDERDTVLTLTAILEDAGHEAKGVHDARAALGAIADFDPDVVLADIAMPGMTGWDMAREIRKVGGEERPVLIAISGHYMKAGDRALAQMVGFRHFLSKPCDPNELLGLLAPIAETLE